MSYSVYWRRILQFRATKETTVASKSHICFALQNPSYLLKLVSYISNDATTTDQQPSLTVSYLINSCGLSPQSALSASKKIQLKSTKKPDSVLELFRNLGLTETQITKVVSKCPFVLLSKPEKTLLPKINVFTRYGFSGPELGRVLSNFPSLFRESFNNKIIPAFDFLRSVVHTDENIAACVRSSVSYFRFKFPEKISACVSILRNYGVPDSKIVRLFLITSHPKALFLNVDRFSESAACVKEMGFDPFSSNFIVAVHVMAGSKKSSWDKKLEVYRSLGWSEDEFRSAFKVQPKCMMTSEEKIKKVAHFLLSVMGWKPSVLSKCPNLLNYSLEKRIAPRCSVLRLLIAKGLIKEDLNLIWLLNERESTFATRILIKYQDSVPEITRVYRCKVGSIASGSVDAIQT